MDIRTVGDEMRRDSFVAEYVTIYNSPTALLGHVEHLYVVCLDVVRRALVVVDGTSVPTHALTDAPARSVPSRSTVQEATPIHSNTAGGDPGFVGETNKPHVSATGS